MGGPAARAGRLRRDGQRDLSAGPGPGRAAPPHPQGDRADREGAPVAAATGAAPAACDPGPARQGEPPPRATRGIGPYAGGSRARRRRSSASPIHLEQPPRWLGSSPPCSGSIPPAGRPAGRTTSSAACRWRCATRSPAPRSQPCTARSMRPQRPRRGKQPSRRRRGTGPPVWLHGDLHSGNLLAERGRLSAVIDFGLLAVGDPACDLMVAWTLLSAADPGGVPRGAAGRRRDLGARSRLGAVVRADRAGLLPGHQSGPRRHRPPRDR